MQTEAGAKVSLNKATLLSALTINSNTLASTDFASADNSANAAGAIADFTFAAADAASTMSLNDASVGVFNQALENIAALRAQNGGSMSRLNFASDNATKQSANMEAAYGRIMDVDIAAESTRLAKYNVLVQSSAAMLSQANTPSDAVLMLLALKKPKEKTLNTTFKTTRVSVYPNLIRRTEGQGGSSVKQLHKEIIKCH